MARAKVTLDLEPAEFDLVREVLAEAREVCSERSRLTSEWSQSASTQERRDNNARGMRLHDLIQKLT